MRVFNYLKTLEITKYDLNLGYLKPDVLKYTVTYVNNGNGTFTITKTYETGNVEVETIKAVDYYAAPNGHERIQIYVPYTETELYEISKAKLREKRKPLLEAFDKWEKAVLRGREADSSSVMSWYKSLLNLEESAFENIPLTVQYYVY